MYRSIEITGYRCFDHLKVSDLARVNIICGANNSGKTALLEAIYLHAMRGDRLSVLDVVRRFGAESSPEAPQFWESLFWQFRTKQDVTISADWREGAEAAERAGEDGEQPASEATSVRLHEVSDREELSASLAEWTRRLPPVERNRLEELDVHGVLRVEYRGPRDHASGYLTPADAGKYRRALTSGEVVPFIASRSALTDVDGMRFGDVALDKQTPEIAGALNIIEPRLTDLRSLPGTATIYGEIGLPRLVSLRDMGEGTQRLLSLALALWSAGGDVVLVDEIENGLHHTVLRDVWRLIGDAARRFDVQVFAATHSWECIVAAHQAFRESGPDDLRVHRLQAIGGQVRDFVYSDEELEAAIETGLEVR